VEYSAQNNSGSLENLTYNYPTNGTNNGKISSMYNAISGETVTYTYDSLNRLLTANGSGWGQQYGFDSFGNLLSKTVTAGSGPSLSQAVNPTNNQIVGGSYDANGNTGAAYNRGVNQAAFIERRVRSPSGNARVRHSSRRLRSTLVCPTSRGRRCRLSPRFSHTPAWRTTVLR